MSEMDSLNPRFLRHRNRLKIYILYLVISCFIFCCYWGIQLHTLGLKKILENYQIEIALTLIFYLISFGLYLFWFKPLMKRSIQVYKDFILIHNDKKKSELAFSEVFQVKILIGSFFYLKLKDGSMYFFDARLERVDYVWEGLAKSRPDLLSKKEFEDFRLKLIQYDHHEKRRELFFKHNIIDVFSWCVFPSLFLIVSYVSQSQSIVIHHQSLYFFRLFMFVILILLCSTFLFSAVLKKFVFDVKLTEQAGRSDEKIRDIEFEGIILQRSKLFQLIFTSFVLMIFIKFDGNMYSVSKVKESIASFQLKKGTTLVVDNRYNCVNCKFQLSDGDLVIFGRGIIGQVMAKEGDVVALVSENSNGRTIASTEIQEVPKGHVAIRSSNGKDIVFIRIEELIGKIQR